MKVSPARWLMAPVDAGRIFTGTKSFADPILGSEALNRQGLHVWRTRLAHRLAERRRRRLAHLVSEADREAFARDGYVAKQGFLADDAFARLVEEVMTTAAPAREIREGNAVTRHIVVTDAYLKRVPALLALLEHPDWRGLTRYIGSFDEEPIVSVQAIFGQASDAVEDPQTTLHMDTFHPTMKAWFFLHDVGDDEGPFTYVPSSHRLTPRRLAWQKRKSVVASRSKSIAGAFRLRADELRYLRWPQPVRFAVPANTLVVGDTCGFHARASSAKPTMRIEIYAYGRPNPFKPDIGLSTARVPYLGRSREAVNWWLQDRLSSVGLGPSKWRDAGVIRPDEPAHAL